ncbi:MAG: SOS response-associated peptidase [Gemmatimonadota bacterium]|nr:SOS response-associated peptidase [Gemmatimonadota bacterium]
MCGRAYALFTEADLATRYLKGRPATLGELTPTQNLAPTQRTPIVREVNGARELARLRWGLVPSWARELTIGASMINARAETVAEKPSFRVAFRQRRCIVPLSGFIEWQREGTRKRPFAIYREDRAILSVAGLWERWADPAGGEVQTFTVITTAANGFMAPIHDRMPVILEPGDEDTWLSADTEPAALHALLVPCAEGRLAAHEVSSSINSPRNDAPELLEPVGDALR